MPIGLIFLVFVGVWAAATWTIHGYEQRQEERLGPSAGSTADEVEEWLRGR